MPTWLKVVLIVGGVLVVLVIASAIGIFFMAKRYLPEMVEASKQIAEEGERYGRQTDNEGCVNETASRHKQAKGFGDLIKEPIFLQTCLDVSRPTPGFCDNVPTAFEFTKSAHWQLDECKRYGLSPESQCGQIFQQVQQFCERKRRTGTLVDRDEVNANDGDAQGSEPPAPPPPPKPPSSR